MQQLNPPLFSLISNSIKIHDPCRLVDKNTYCGAMWDIHYVLVYTIKPELVTCSCPTQTPGLLIFSEAAWARICPPSGSFIGDSDYHPPWVFHLPVSPHVPNHLFAQNLWRKQIKQDEKFIFFVLLHWWLVCKYLCDSPVESTHIFLVYPGLDKPLQFDDTRYRRCQKSITSYWLSYHPKTNLSSL